MQTLVAEMYQYSRAEILKRDITGAAECEWIFTVRAYKMYCKIWELRISFGEFEVGSFLTAVSHGRMNFYSIF